MLEKFKTNKQVVAFSSLELGDVSECGRNKKTSINYYKGTGPVRSLIISLINRL